MHNEIIQEQPEVFYFPEPQLCPLTWIEIDSHAFNHNVAQYKKMVSPALFAVVVKSNAYGHGMQHIASLAQKNNAVDYICTVSLSEAVTLRKNGITKPLLVLSIIDDALELACIHAIDVVVFDRKQALAFNQIGLQFQKKIKIHIKVDTGLSRLGVLYSEVLNFVESLYRLPFLTVQGIFTHFAESEKSDQTFTNLQIERFEEVLEALEEKNITIPLKHASCSAAITATSRSHFTMARAGIGIYGLWPSHDTKMGMHSKDTSFVLKPLLTWKTKIIHMKEVPAGSCVGYNRTHRVVQDSRIATLPIGYWDGYDRKLSNKGFVLINNQRAPCVGTIAMNLMMVDVTGLNVSIDDDVILLGNYAGITAEDLAGACNTINYEFVTRINPLLPRIMQG